MAFDDFFVEQVRNSASIVDFVGRYVPLTKKGKDYGALCPFHNEKTPSFWVSEHKQIFKCFGCGVGGDVYAFAMQIENLQFPEAIRFVAEVFGVPLPDAPRQERKAAQEKDRLLKLMERAAHLFCEALKGDAGALRYLQERGIDGETARSFGIGFAPPGNAALRKLLDQGFTRKEALDCGVAKENERGEIYANFRNRVMFPIRNLSGRTIAFGGRLLQDGHPKYLNSPETPLYSKSLNLFGLDLARQAIRQQDQAILVEGYFDCIIPSQAGFANIAASLGTSLTREQVSLMGRFTRNVVINYDPDLAGANATLRSIHLLLEHGFQVQVMELPGGRDPDSFIRESGAEAYRDLLGKARSFLEYALEKSIGSQADPYGPRGRREVVAQMLPFLQKVNDKIERAGYVTKVASRLGVDEHLLWDEIRRIASKGKGSQETADKEPVGATPAERILLSSVLDPALRERVLEQVRIELFRGLATEPLFQVILQLAEENAEFSIPQIRSRLTEEGLKDLLERAAFGRDPLPYAAEEIRGSVESLRIELNKRRMAELQSELDRGDLPLERQLKLATQYQVLARENREMRTRV